MCVTAPGQVVEVDADGAIVDTGGVRRRASTLVVPDAVAGDWVMVGAGTILRRLDPVEAGSIAETITSAIADSRRPHRPEGAAR
jgi:hydrogenase assembly chaperone HypC/HupF